jgi:sulfoxide reductase heme-binding subunit YedZ
VTAALTAVAATPGAGSALWYLSRGTGVVVLVLLTIVVVLGVLTRRGAQPGASTLVTAAVHRNASLLAVALLVVHVVTAVLDPYAPIRLVDAVVPFVSAYRPVWLGLGALALDLLIALIVTSLLRLRIGLRWWRGVHWLGYAAWPIAAVHAAGTGTDTGTRWNLIVVTGCVLSVVVAAISRARIVAEQAPGRGTAVRLVALGAPVAFGAWLIAGPLAPGWAARSGTPTPQLAGARAASNAGASTSGAAGASGAAGSRTTPLGTARWSGRISEQDGAGSSVVQLSGALVGGPAGRLVIRLVGAPATGGGIQLSSGTATLTLPDGASWTGPVTGLDGPRITARLTAGSGAVALAAAVQLDAAASAFTGSVVLR